MTDLTDIPAGVLLELYRTMLEIRKVELRIGELYSRDEMRTPIHLCIGQEAVAAGVCMNLDASDYMFSNHRGHGHYIAKKGDLKAMIAELYNKETGCSRGRGGSMHLVDARAGILGSSSIVAGGIPLAAGAALASKLRGEARVSVVFFGDGAAEEGVLYESINFAVLKELPVIFVCENNLYAVCSPLRNRQPDKDIYKRAAGFSIPACKIDGNNVLEVYRESGKAAGLARRGGGPSFIECATYRLKDHHDNKSGVELGYRTQEELDFWEGKCPVRAFEGVLTESGLLTADKIRRINEEIDEKIREAFEFAAGGELPERKELVKYLYGGR